MLGRTKATVAFTHQFVSLDAKARVGGEKRPSSLGGGDTRECATVEQVSTEFA